MKFRLTFWCLSMAALLSAMGCAAAVRSHNLPPAERLMHPGPGVGGPGPGVLPPMMPISAISGIHEGQQQSVQLLFNQPDGMQVRWDVTSANQFDSEPLIVPGRKDFPEGGIYRLKLTNIPDREGQELYPTLEVGPTTPRTAAYLAHNAIPIQFTAEDFDQVLSGNFVTKVIYLPDPEFQEIAMALGTAETLVSTRLDPGVDPIVEADRRGSIMAVVRLGNKDVQSPGATPGDVQAVTFQQHVSGEPVSIGGGFNGAPLMPQYVSGVTTPAWGMPTSGTPIGLPGPPHIPFGSPAGLQKHVMRNHTQMHIPGPVERFRVDVREMPGYSYPRPPHHMSIREQHIHPSLPFYQSQSNQMQVIPMNAGAGCVNCQ